ncbi:TonB-dependent receptor [Terricaulis silvestris]|uniref:Pesticin receptor n=1 Tax=Terricaulis silvestris TaxID=2686094 RepID=A0A6I6MKR2_9CAUL|nr:TonB-dependent receptor [Terricaulis silvestris]QGZ93746.1 Pesticin receptor [Terricaulis silvestris]
MSGKSALLVASAVCAATATALAVVATPAAAQETEANGTTIDSGEVIVTAQRREERLQDVPISVTALSAAQLESRGVTSTSDLTTVAPGLTMSETSSFVQPFIRGVGSLTTSVGDQGSVATYVDGVYMPLVQTGLYDLANVASVEVLKGPQGTLFGRNTSGGAILITTRRPEDEFSGHFDASYGNYDDANLRGYVTGPIANGVSASLAGSYGSHEGWIDDRFYDRTVGEAERYSARATVLIEPNDRLSVTLNAHYLYADDANGVLNSPVGGYAGFTPGDLLPDGPYQFVGDLTPTQTSRQAGGSVRVAYHFDAVDLISLTAAQDLKTVVVFDNDSTPDQIIELRDTETGDLFSQEFQLQSNGSGQFRWMVGAFYYNQDSHYAPLDVFIAPATALHITADHGDEAHAIFADGTYTMGPFELTAGLRYNHETKDVTAILNGFTIIDGATETWESVTPRVVLAYKPTDGLMFYASYSQGFKSGAYNVSGLSPVPVDPEEVDAYELGVKWRVSPDLTIDAAAYFYQTSNLQVQAIDPITGLQLLDNAAESESSGFDVDVSWRPTDALHIQFGASYLNAEYTSFPNASVYEPAGGPGDGFTLVSRDVTGNQLVRSPDWTLSLAAEYDIALASGGRITPSINIFNTASFYWDFNNRARSEAYTMVNAQVAWHLPGDQVSLSLWGRNLTDEEIYRSNLTTSIAEQVVWAEPLTYGVRLGYDF